MGGKTAGAGALGFEGFGPVVEPVEIVGQVLVGGEAVGVGEIAPGDGLGDLAVVEIHDDRAVRAALGHVGLEIGVEAGPDDDREAVDVRGVGGTGEEVGDDLTVG